MARVAVLQMTSSSRVNDNLQFLEAYFRTAKEENIKLIVLPENFALMGFMEDDKFLVAEEFGKGIIQDTVSKLARQFQLWVIAGTIPIRTSGRKIRASSLVFDEKGRCVARYDKIHLFDVRISEHEVHQETATIERGENVVVVDTPIGRVGLSVCYDLRFPELYQSLREKGAEIFTVPSAFTAVTGLAHWEILLRARAIENLAYVVAPNQCGTHENGRQTYGHSMLIEPWGKIIQEQHLTNGLIYADIDLQRLRQLRKQFPCNDHHILTGIL
jgi:predicted amidohydrolase